MNHFSGIVVTSCALIMGEAYNRTSLGDAQTAQQCCYLPTSDIITEEHVQELERNHLVIIQNVLNQSELEGVQTGDSIASYISCKVSSHREPSFPSTKYCEFRLFFAHGEEVHSNILKVSGTTDAWRSEWMFKAMHVRILKNIGEAIGYFEGIR